jgi:hypothetical protein
VTYVRWSTSRRQAPKRSVNNFEKGLQTDVSPFFASENAMIDGYGWDFGKYPALSVRVGRTTYGASGGAITRLLTNFGNTHLVRAVGTTLQYYNGSAWTDIATGLTSADYDSTNFDISGPALIVTNGTDTPSYWNGTTRTTIAGMPKGKYVASDNRRVYTGGVTGSLDSIYYCAFQNAADWSTPENSGEVQFYTANGGPITAMRAFEGQIWAFKKDAYCLVFHTGDAKITHRLVEGSNDIGCVSHKTLVEVGPYLMWLGQSTVYIGAGGAATDIGDEIKRYLDDINQDYIQNSFAFVDDLKYYLCIPTGSNQQPDTCLVYDSRFRKWLPYSATLGGLRYGAQLNGVSYTGDLNGQTFIMNNGTTDNGSAIPYMVESRPFDDGMMEAEKELFEMHIQGYFPTGTTLGVEVSPYDQGDDWTEIKYDPISALNVTQSKNLIVPLDTVPLANFYRYRISGTGPAEIQQIQRYARIQPVQI